MRNSSSLEAQTVAVGVARTSAEGAACTHRLPCSRWSQIPTSGIESERTIAYRLLFLRGDQKKLNRDEQD